MSTIVDRLDSKAVVEAYMRIGNMVETGREFGVCRITIGKILDREGIIRVRGGGKGRRASVNRVETRGRCANDC